MITAATLGLFSFYYDASTDDYLKILAVSLGLTALAVWITLLRTLPADAPDPGVDRRRPRRGADQEGVGGGRLPAARADPHATSRSRLLVTIIPACHRGR